MSEFVRAAFLTPEYPTETQYGGLARYVRRMAQSLVAHGHEAEVFVSSERGADTFAADGVTVHLCPPTPPARPDFMDRMVRAIARTVDVADAIHAVRGARALARAFEARDAEAPFDFVQSSDYMAAGLFVAPRAGRPHLVRASWARDLFNRIDGRPVIGRTVMSVLERRAMTSADAVYAPSEFVARHHRTRYGLRMSTVRPPAVLEVAPAAPPSDLPPRFLAHVARIGARKGSDLLAEALPLVWQQAPELTMVWIGEEMYPGTMARYRARWGSQAGRIDWRGGMDAARTFGVVREAQANVLPSIVDNLPNTAIESLLLDVPVIGTRGTSLDELVEHERNGLLCSPTDSRELAEALLRVWQGDVPWNRVDFRSADRLHALSPAAAVRALIDLACRTGMRPSSAAGACP